MSVINETHPLQCRKPITRIGSCIAGHYDAFTQPSRYSLLYVINSSTTINSLVLETDEHSAARINKDSRLWSSCCKIEINEKIDLSTFICDGDLFIDCLDVESVYITCSLIESSVGKDYLSHISSSVEIKTSIFRDMGVCSSGGGLISGRGIRTEEMIENIFMNVSIIENEEEYTALVANYVDEHLANFAEIE